mmetsp:Transcript_43759/g.76792  ORF Transcript_43759/g.76792 Transcript_43759/m.76792 type:complete len:793 (+) Transcript_43759:105-2483(+)
MPPAGLIALGSLVSANIILTSGGGSSEHDDLASGQGFRSVRVDAQVGSWQRELSSQASAPGVMPRPAERQSMSVSTACPDTNLIRNMALGFWYTTWGKLQCSHAFSEESLQMVVRDVPEQPAQCDVVFYGPYGDLQVRIAPATQNIVGAQARAPIDRTKVAHAESGWRALDRRVCLLSSVIGLAPVTEVVPTDIVRFAFHSLVLERGRPELVQRTCGGSLSLVSTEGMNSAVAVTEQRLERIFFIEVMEGADPFPIPVQVRIEERWTVTPANKTDIAYAFLSSTPLPCQISVKTPFAVFGCSGRNTQRRLQEDSAEIGADPAMLAEKHAEPTAVWSGVPHATGDATTASRLLAAAGPIDGNMPQEYNLRQSFPHCGQPPRGSGRCSAAWAFAAVGAFEKQLCRLTEGAIAEPLSRQRIIECATESAGCDGGSIFDAHAAMLAAGSVISENCYPYRGNQPSAPGMDRCQPPDSPCARRFSARYPSVAETAYQTRLTSAAPGAAATNIVMGEKAMQAAILMYGAITASFTLLPDFLLYREGIYTGTRMDATESLGTHAVQLIGWGIESTMDPGKYWIAENSWGPLWGENQDFQRCSVVDCRGPFCSDKESLSPNCADSVTWRDGLGNGCSWYAKQDPGCRLFADKGQMTHCRRTCLNCVPPLPRNGEICGYFRILRGQNTLGIEAAAAHTYVAGLAPAESSLGYLGPTCEDDVAWLDAWGKSCSWYTAQDAGCTKFQDIGQRAFCRKTCGTCPGSAVQVVPPTSLDKDLSGDARAVAAPVAALLVAMIFASIRC